MKVLIVSDCFLPRWDGIARFLAEIINHLHKSLDITVLAPRFPGPAAKFPTNVKIHRARLLPIQFADIRFAYPSRKKLRELISKTDVVFTQTIGPLGATAVMLASKANRPIISFVHNIEWDLVSKSIKRFRYLAYCTTKLLARHLYRKSKLILCPSKEIATLLTNIGVLNDKKAVQLGVDLNTFAPTEDKAKAKSRIGIEPSKIVIGYHGRIAREKSLPTLVEAFKDLQKENKNIVLLIVGGGLKGEVKSSKDIVLVGSQNNVVPYLQAMDIYVTPSLTETSSLATMEAMAMGLPVVATPVGLINEYIQDGKNGFIFERKDVPALVSRLKQLIADEDTRKWIGKGARKTSEERFDINSTMVAIKEIILNIKEVKTN